MNVSPYRIFNKSEKVKWWDYTYLSFKCKDSGRLYTFSDYYSRFGYVHRKFDALDTFIEFKAGSNNLLGMHTNSLWLGQGDMSSSFDSFHWNTRLFPILCTKVSITKCRGGKKISNLDGHSEITDRFLILSLFFLGICLIDYVIHFFLKRYISLEDIEEDF